MPRENMDGLEPRGWRKFALKAGLPLVSLVGRISPTDQARKIENEGKFTDQPRTFKANLTLQLKSIGKIPAELQEVNYFGVFDSQEWLLSELELERYFSCSNGFSDKCGLISGKFSIKEIKVAGNLYISEIRCGKCSFYVKISGKLDKHGYKGR